MKFKAVLFDMDGVLIDSEDLMQKAGVMALAEYGIECTQEDFIPFTGTGEDNFMGGVARKYGHEYELKMKDRCYYHYGEHVEEFAFVPEGLLDTLNALKENGVKIAVCTSADQVKVNHNYRAIGVDASFFDAVITGDDIVNKKPDPEIYITGAAAVSIDPADCLVVEDAPSGIKAGRAGGMTTCGVTSTFDAAYLKEQADPDLIINKIPELLDIVL